MEPEFKRIVIRRGQVIINGNLYTHKDLEHYHGQQVLIKVCPANDRHIMVMKTCGAVIGVAEYRATKQDFFPVAVVEKAAKSRAARRLARVTDLTQQLHQEQFECPSCGHKSNHRTNFCGACGDKIPQGLKPIDHSCPACGAQPEGGSLFKLPFCCNCGVRLIPAAG